MPPLEGREEGLIVTATVFEKTGRLLSFPGIPDQLAQVAHFDRKTECFV